MMKQTILLLGLAWLCCPTVALAQSIPPSLHARILQLEDERNLNGDELAKLLKHASSKVRERAALAIGRIGERRKEVIDALMDVLEKDTNEQVRAMAAFALGEIEDVRAVPPLLSAALTWRWPAAPDQVQARIIEALGKIASAPGNAEVLSEQERKNVVSNAMLKIGLADDLATLDGKLMTSIAITALMRLRSPSSISTLTGQLKSKDADIRAQAANALSRIRQPIASAVPALLEALNDSDHNVRANAARALGASKDARAVEPLIKLLGDKSEQVQVTSIRALALLNDKRATTPLIDFAEKMLDRYFKEEEGIGTKETLIAEIAAALGSLRDTKAIPLLRQFRSFRGIGAFPEVEIAIAHISEKEFYERGQLYREHWKALAALAQGLGELDTEEAKEMLLLVAGEVSGRNLSKANPEILRALAKRKPNTLQKLLKGSLLDEDIIARATAANLLVGFQDTETYDALAEALKESANDQANDAKLAILTAISKYKSEKAVESIKLSLNDPDHLVRRRAIELLKQLGAGDFSDRVGIVQTGHNKLFYQRVVARMNRKVTATIHTDVGTTITMELFPQDAPITVDSFITLARKGYFNNLTFHRVVPNFVIQGGDPRGDGEGGPGYQIRCEVNTRPYERGSLGMALSGKDTGGSQFFITHSPQPHLDGGYTVFGQVTKGMEVVDQIVRGVVIRRIEISER